MRGSQPKHDKLMQEREKRISYAAYAALYHKCVR